ncbi:class I SAM-dependent methyltransferase [Allobranchiibius sp. GilTou38]|uniref:class I SAM-dependent methyltransferase n=1 Tax=Allobranchiibius sp. GilTou38 TaxID=2815210 RepID=UPI001AA0DD29|nr:class I SAM-dependent methyltransferase [Allobranchiibius sp. GilTou38]MBO1767316.1 class I SAM-dependent methyltransferase [Allobranchiibius sp. GilTou38]
MHAHRTTRWESSDHRDYGRTFADLRSSGADITGEARLADVIAPRHARILDAGSGMGRIGAALQDRGHDVVGVDLDPALLEQSRESYPHLPVVEARLDELTPEILEAEGHPTTYDVIVCVGNVMILLAPDTEPQVLGRLRALLAPEGRMLVGFHLQAKPRSSRTYPAQDFIADVQAAGLRVEARFASYDLLPSSEEADYAVFLLRAL